MESDSNLNEKLARVLELKREIDERKALYAELDLIILSLVHEGHCAGDVLGVVEGKKLELVDNFAEGNTVFRPAGVHRFDVKEVKEPKAKKVSV